MTSSPLRERFYGALDKQNPAMRRGMAGLLAVALALLKMHHGVFLLLGSFIRIIAKIFAQGFEDA